MTYLYFDIETLDLISKDKGLSELRFGIAVTYEPQSFKKWKRWNNPEALLWKLVSGSTLVGWNVRDFDLKVLSKYCGEPYLYDLLHEVPVYDLFAEIRKDTGRWYRLGVIAQENLGTGKSGDGLQAVEWLNTQDRRNWARALSYCKEDVRLTRDLHEKIVRGEWLKLPGRDRRGEGQRLLWRPGEIRIDSEVERE